MLLQTKTHIYNTEEPGILIFYSGKKIATVCRVTDVVEYTLPRKIKTIAWHKKSLPHNIDLQEKCLHNSFCECVFM